NDVAVLWAHIRTDPPLPSDSERALDSFDGIIDRALAKDPRERYATCGKLAEDVRRAAQVRKRPAPAVRARLPRARRRARRRWLVPALGAALLGAAAGGVVGFSVAGGDRPARVVTVERGRAPDPSVLAYVPAQLRRSCVRAEPPTPDFDESVACTPSD